MPEVFFKKITRQNLLNNTGSVLFLLEKAQLYSRLKDNDFVGIKIHFGEKGNQSYISPKIIKPLVNALKQRKTKPFLFDTNTLYHGKRANALDHLTLAAGHGFSSVGAPLLIADGLRGKDFITVNINKHHYTKCFIAALWKDTDFILCASHFTLHMLMGFGGAIKNLGMGLASRRGKLAQHCELSPRINEEECTACGKCSCNCPVQAITKKDSYYAIIPEKCIGCAQCISVCSQNAVKINWSGKYTLLQERMVEYAYAATRNDNCAYINFCLYLTKECDCMNKEPKGFVEDLGVLFSYDPVALDKASVDLLIKREGRDVIKEAHPDVEYMHQFEYAQRIGLGNANYNLIEL